MRESCAESDSFKSQLREESRFSIGDSALCGDGLSRLSWRHQFGSHAPSTAVDARDHSLDHLADSVRSDALAMRDTWNCLVPFGPWCVHPRYCPGHRHRHYDLLIYFSGVFPSLRGASRISKLAQAEPPNLRN